MLFEKGTLRWVSLNTRNQIATVQLASQKRCTEGKGSSRTKLSEIGIRYPKYAEPGRRYGSLRSTITRGDITHHGRAAFRKTGKKEKRRKTRGYPCRHRMIEPDCTARIAEYHLYSPGSSVNLVRSFVPHNTCTSSAEPCLGFLHLDDCRSIEYGIQDCNC